MLKNNKIISREEYLLKHIKYQRRYRKKHRLAILARETLNRRMRGIPQKATPLTKDELLARRRIREKNRIKTDFKFRVNRNIGTILYMSLKGKKAGRKWQDILGYGLNELMKHLESKFVTGMTWDNYGKHWHVDHIKPRSLFNITSEDCAEIKECWSLDNLQPLWARDNVRKHNKYITA